ncbi:MAG: DinB family protein [Anaerolineae bacterium]
MDKIELMQYSLGFAFDLLQQVTSDLTQEQADWTPPGVANPIGALYWHTVAYSDQLAHSLCMPPFRDITPEEWATAGGASRDLEIGQVPLWRSAGWQEEVILKPLPENPKDPFWNLRAAPEGPRVALPALRDYSRAVAQALDSFVVSLTAADLSRTISTPIGDYSMDAFIEVFITWHINAHCGEIAALKGCQGLKGYPW